MSLPTQTQKRLSTIKHGITQGFTQQQIGKQCHVTRRTIIRDMQLWVESPDFNIWIREEAIRLHSQVTQDNPELAYIQIMKLLAKSLVAKAEVVTKQEIIERITIDATVDEDKILSQAARILTRKRKSQKIH